MAAIMQLILSIDAPDDEPFTLNIAELKANCRTNNASPPRSINRSRFPTVSNMGRCCQPRSHRVGKLHAWRRARAHAYASREAAAGNGGTPFRNKQTATAAHGCTNQRKIGSADGLKN